MTDITNYGTITLKKINTNTIESGKDTSLAPTIDDRTHDGDIVIKAISEFTPDVEMKLHSNTLPSLKFNHRCQIANIKSIEHTTAVTINNI